MPFPVTCPECDSTQKVSDEASGKKVRCKSCQAVFRAVPPHDGGNEDAPATRKRGRVVDEDRPRKRRSPDRRRSDDEDDDRPDRRKRSKRNPLPLILGLVGLVLVLGCGGVGAYLVFGGRSEKVFTPPDGMYTVTFPGTPRQKPGAAGETTYELETWGHRYESSVGDVRMFFSDPSRRAQERDIFLQFAVEHFLEFTKGKQVSRRWVDYQGHVGAEIHVRHPDGAETVARMFATPRNGLRVAVTGNTLEMTKATRFLDSLSFGTAFGPPIAGAADLPIDPEGPRRDAPVVVADLAQVVREFRADARAAEAKYKGKVLRFTGTVKAVHVSGAQFDLAADGMNVVVVLKRSNPALAVGQVVTLTAEVKELQQHRGVPPRLVFSAGILE
jgi:predicted Zn finger-like uncharacterized protein